MVRGYEDFQIARFEAMIQSARLPFELFCKDYVTYLSLLPRSGSGINLKEASTSTGRAIEDTQDHISIIKRVTNL